MSLYIGAGVSNLQVDGLINRRSINFTLLHKALWSQINKTLIYRLADLQMSIYIDSPTMGLKLKRNKTNFYSFAFLIFIWEEMNIDNYWLEVGPILIPHLFKMHINKSLVLVNSIYCIKFNCFLSIKNNNISYDNK